MKKNNVHLFLLCSSLMSTGISLPLILNISNVNSIKSNKNKEITKYENKIINKNLDKNFFNTDSKYFETRLGWDNKWYGGNADKEVSYTNITNFNNKINFLEYTKNYIIGNNIKFESYNWFSNTLITIKESLFNNYTQSLVIPEIKKDDIKSLINPYEQIKEINGGFSSLSDEQFKKQNNVNFNSNEIHFNLNSNLSFNSFSKKNSILVFNKYFESRKKYLIGRDLAQSNLRMYLVQNYDNTYSFELSSSFFTSGDIGTVSVPIFPILEYDDPYLKHFLEAPKISFNITLPYSKSDLSQFKELFNQVVAAPIRLKNVKNPILFEYGNDGTMDGTTNEYKVRTIIEERAKQFYKNINIINKLGAIANNDGNQNVDVSHIKLYIEPSKRGKTGTQEVKVRFNLGIDKNPDLISQNSYDENRQFYFEDSAESYFELPIKIYVQLDPEVDLDIDKLVHITPFKSASNEYEISYQVQKDLNIKVADNDPDPLSINNFKTNINKIKRNGIYQSLIPKEKLPIINKVGTYINVEMQINIDGIIINKNIKFDRLFNNGTIFTVVNFDENDYQNSSFKINNNQIFLGLEMKNDEVNIFNSEQISLINKNATEEELNQSVGKINISFTKASVQIPSEQMTRESKWIQTKDRKQFDEENITFAGEFKTYDPFIFKLDIQNLPLYDPITGEFMGYASKYKPFIRKGKFDESSIGSNKSDDEAIFPTPTTGDDDGYYEANLGSYVMKNKAEAINGEFNFQIVVKEYNDNKNSKNTSNEEKYTKDRWIISISMNLLTSKANFIMSGYQDNQLIKDENEQKYFNEDSSDYRGDFVDEKTGMYIPKIVWVNAYPPEAFLYDPVDQNGNLIVSKDLEDNEYLEASKKAKYDIGYIAELNATGFVKDDYSALTTFGGYETIFDTKVFQPTGLIPYSEFYTYNKNSIIPNIEKIPLSQSGLQTVKSTADFRQVILKRANSNTYLYQFIKIAKNSTEIRNNKDLVSLYGTLYGLQNKPLFIDFWDTYQGKHLLNYLVNEYKLIESEEKTKALSYEDVVQYWNLYVNDPSHYKNESTSTNDKYDISQIKLKQFDLKINQFNLLKQAVIEKIKKELEAALIDKSWIGNGYKLEYDKHFKIENTIEEFDEKIRFLLAEYEKPLNEAKFISFNIIMIEEGFEPEILIKPTGKTTIKILNNKDADKIIDLSKEAGSRLEINTSKPYFSNSSNLIKTICDEIYKSINKDFEYIFKKSELDLEPNYTPILNKDYELIFFVENKFNNEVTYETKYIDEAIKDVILFETDQDIFYNILKIEIRAKFNDESHYMKNSFYKTIINNSSQEEAIKDSRPFDLSTIKANDIKINTQHPDFPNDENKTKAEIIYDLLLERIANDISFWARKWIYVNKINLIYGIDYQIRIIKNYDENGHHEYYQASNKFEFLAIINDVLLNGLETEFNRNLYIEIYSINSANLSSSFIKKINNNHLNVAIEDDNLGNVIIDSDNNSNIGEDEIQDLLNQMGKKDNLDMWWIITPLTILGLIITCAVIVFVVRKNRRIR